MEANKSIPVRFIAYETKGVMNNLNLVFDELRQEKSKLFALEKRLKGAETSELIKTRYKEFLLNEINTMRLHCFNHTLPVKKCLKGLKELNQAISSFLTVESFLEEKHADFDPEDPETVAPAPDDDPMILLANAAIDSVKKAMRQHAINLHTEKKRAEEAARVQKHLIEEHMATKKAHQAEKAAILANLLKLSEQKAAEQATLEALLQGLRV